MKTIEMDDKDIIFPKGPYALWNRKAGSDITCYGGIIFFVIVYLINKNSNHDK
jgi:hypothetical protein